MVATRATLREFVSHWRVVAELQKCPTRQETILGDLGPSGAILRGLTETQTGATKTVADTPHIHAQRPLTRYRIQPLAQCWSLREIRVYPFALTPVRLRGSNFLRSPPVSFGKSLIHATNPAEPTTNIATSPFGASTTPPPSPESTKPPNTINKVPNRRVPVKWIQ